MTRVCTFLHARTLKPELGRVSWMACGLRGQEDVSPEQVDERDALLLRKISSLDGAKERVNQRFRVS